MRPAAQVDPVALAVERDLVLFAGIEPMISALYFSPMDSKNSTASSRDMTFRSTSRFFFRDFVHPLFDGERGLPA